MSIRILLITVFAAALMLSVRVADLWHGIAIAAGAVAVSPAAAADPAPPAPAASPPSSPAATPASPGAAPAAANATATPPAEAAPAEAAPAEAAPLRPAPEEDFSDAELKTLQSLAKRREELDAREKAVDTREGLLAAGEKRVDQKIAELKDLQGKIKGLLKTYDEQETGKLKSLVKIYENMKPKDAAPIFEQLDMDTLLDIVERMKERKVSPILAQMSPAKAKEITDELARRHELSQVAAGAP